MKPHSPTILVLEDEIALQSVIKSKLTSEGFKVVTARTADQAMGYLEEGLAVDGVWLDHYLMGDKSGFDFATGLKQRPAWKDLPVFVVSNTVSSEKIKAYLELGAKKCYTKVDFRLDDIIADIKQYVKGSKS